MMSILFFQVFFNNGLTNNKDDFELCLRQENIVLPKTGYFGITAATGGLAGKGDITGSGLSSHQLTQSSHIAQPS